MLFLSTLLGASGLLSDYPFSLNPLPNYNFHWRTDSENFYIALNVSTNGWVGFGIAEPTSGSMPGSDMFRAYVNPNGVATILDGYALGKVVPVTDTCQDWVLVSSARVDGRAIVEASRKLVTGDPQDRPVSTTDMSRLVFSYSASTSFYTGHEANRVGLAVNLADGSIPVFEGGNGIGYFDIRNAHTPDSSQVTEYYDATFPVPITGPVHMIGASMLTDSAEFKLVHHVTLAGFYANQDNHYLFIWAPGVGDLELHAPCGFRLGNTSGSSVVSLQMQTHYNNPTLAPTVQDTTGVRIYYTTTLRSNDCGVISFGDPSIRLAASGPLPQGLSAYAITCPASLTAALQTQVMTVFASALHMHALGQQIWTTVNGAVQNKIDFYDFGFQQTTNLMGKGFTIKAGDVVKTTCVYNAPDANKVFGLASSQEMCINYVFYYPRLPTSSCGVETPGVTYTKNPINAVFPRAFAATGGNCSASPTAAGDSGGSGSGGTNAPTVAGGSGAPTPAGSSGAPTTTTGSTGAPTPAGSNVPPKKGAASSAYLTPMVLVAMIVLTLVN